MCPSRWIRHTADANKLLEVLTAANFSGELAQANYWLGQTHAIKWLSLRIAFPWAVCQR